MADMVKTIDNIPEKALNDLHESIDLIESQSHAERFDLPVIESLRVDAVTLHDERVLLVDELRNFMGTIEDVIARLEDETVKKIDDVVATVDAEINRRKEDAKVNANGHQDDNAKRRRFEKSSTRKKQK